MLSGPFKLIVGTAVVAVLMGSVLAAKGPGTPSGAAAPPQPQAHSKGWFSGWFDGMEFNRKAPPAPVTAATPAQARQPGMAAGYGRVDLKSDAGGQYSAQVEIDGQRIPMLVDTGATLVTLRPGSSCVSGGTSSSGPSASRRRIRSPTKRSDGSPGR